MDKSRDSAKFALTFDIDWAPDWIIDQVASILVEHRVQSTWFVTHDSSAINRLRQMPELFEIGIHPNCLPGSTHGNNEDEVLEHMKAIVPESISMRTHGLYQTSNFLMKAAGDYGIKIDVSLLLPGGHHIEPHLLKWGETTLYRVPFFWEDDLEMSYESPSWKLLDPKYHCPGLKVFNFHPIHIALNTPIIDLYNELKSKHLCAEWTPELVKNYRWNGEGPRSLLMELVNLLERGGTFIREIVGL